MQEDFLNELAELALGSRLKRVSERMMVDASAVYEHFNMAIQPKWFTLIALLDKKQRVSVVEASKLLGLTQPAVSQFSRQMADAGLIDISLDQQDSRKKWLSLSAKGRQEVDKLRPVWKAVDSAAKDLCHAFDNHFYQALLRFEKALSQASLLDRSIAHFANNTSSNIQQISVEEEVFMPDSAITFLPFEASLAPFFDSINSQWIEKMFVLEDIDKQVLRFPQQNIIDKGGKIWFAKHASLGIVGTCALLNKNNGAFELTKMGVLEDARGLKVGEKLLQYVITQCTQIPVECLFLLTNAKCEAAIHLYEKNGFKHDTHIMETFGKSYQRCNVAMRWQRT